MKSPGVVLGTSALHLEFDDVVWYYELGQSCVDWLPEVSSIGRSQRVQSKKTAVGYQSRITLQVDTVEIWKAWKLIWVEFIIVEGNDELHVFDCWEEVELDLYPVDWVSPVELYRDDIWLPEQSRSVERVRIVRANRSNVDLTQLDVTLYVIEGLDGLSIVLKGRAYISAVCILK